MMTNQRSFASVMQALLIGLLTLSFALITQRSSNDVYRWGILLLIVSTLFQMAFGNIPSKTGFIRSVLYLGVAAILIGGIVWLSIALVPTLLDLGQ